MTNKHRSSPYFVIVILFFATACQTLILDAPPSLPSVVISTPMPAVEPEKDEISNSSGEDDRTEVLAETPLAIEALRAREYPASKLVIEQTLDPGTNYQRYIAYYSSDGFRIYGLLTVPNEFMPEGGYPAVLFLHGYIPPDTYVTTADYVATQDGLARSGFVTFKPDMRGHGRSEGEATGAHFSETYVVDSLNALSTLEEYDQVNPERIGIWGHSNGGLIGLRMITVTERAKAAVFWAGVVGSYTDMLETYLPRISFLQRLSPPVIKEFGLPSENPEYWNSIDPFHYLDTITTPVQLHHGNSDSSVPVELSISLNNALLAAGREVELFQYPGMDHNFFGEAFKEAMSRSVEFFNDHL
ncbi:MAG: S9 family peptidase [Chloroflexi bacterium]|nr:S9 family peptidase [Chloroflexota bacterium]